MTPTSKCVLTCIVFASLLSAALTEDTVVLADTVSRDSSSALEEAPSVPESEHQFEDEGVAHARVQTGEHALGSVGQEARLDPENHDRPHLDTSENGSPGEMVPAGVTANVGGQPSDKEDDTQLASVVAGSPGRRGSESMDLGGRDLGKAEERADGGAGLESRTDAERVGAGVSSERAPETDESESGQGERDRGEAEERADGGAGLESRTDAERVSAGASALPTLVEERPSPEPKEAARTHFAAPVNDNLANDAVTPDYTDPRSDRHLPPHDDVTEDITHLESNSEQTLHNPPPPQCKALESEVSCYNRDKIPLCSSSGICDRFWVPLGDTTTLGGPVARYGHTLTALNDDILLLFGGAEQAKERSSLMNDMWLYCLSSQRWSRLEFDDKQELPEPRYGHTATAIGDNRLIIFGGRGLEGGRGKALNDAWEYDLGKHTWHSITGSPADPWPQARYFHSATVLGSRIYILGGYVSPKKPASDSLWCFSIHRHHWTAMDDDVDRADRPWRFSDGGRESPSPQIASLGHGDDAQLVAIAGGDRAYVFDPSSNSQWKPMSGSSLVGGALPSSTFSVITVDVSDEDKISRGAGIAVLSGIVRSREGRPSLTKQDYLLNDAQHRWDVFSRDIAKVSKGARIPPPLVRAAFTQARGQIYMFGGLIPPTARGVVGGGPSQTKKLSSAFWRFDGPIASRIMDVCPDQGSHMPNSQVETPGSKDSSFQLPKTFEGSSKAPEKSSKGAIGTSDTDHSSSAPLDRQGSEELPTRGATRRSSPMRPGGEDSGIPVRSASSSSEAAVQGTRSAQEESEGSREGSLGTTLAEKTHIQDSARGDAWGEAGKFVLAQILLVAIISMSCMVYWKRRGRFFSGGPSNVPRRKSSDDNLLRHIETDDRGATYDELGMRTSSPAPHADYRGGVRESGGIRVAQLI